MLRLLKTFKTVYEVKNFSQTADILFISQSTVSVQIKRLETELNTSLFIRNGRQNIIPTLQADLLYQTCIHILQDWEEVCLQIQDNTKYVQQCRIAVSHTFATELLPQLLPELYKNFPSISFSVDVMNSQDVFENIKNKNIQLGLIEKPLSDTSVRRHNLITDQLVIAGDVKNGPWLIREVDSGLRFYTAQYLDEEDIQLPRLEIGSNQVILALIRNGFGCSIVSESLCGGLPFRSLGKNYQRSFYLLESKQTNDITISFVQFIKKWFADYEVNRMDAKLLSDELKRQHFSL
ncbi:LysR family transcriptional regulator [Streptococcus gallinaceus]|uniref:DNA-binding transcriptional LysR family regulator n=1 Tax=Streptococcus gallinaceus TaxID=165758 RepID=A0ABV2JK13_9STRE